jgi:hypothetical protein
MTSLNLMQGQVLSYKQLEEATKTMAILATKARPISGCLYSRIQPYNIQLKVMNEETKLVTNSLMDWSLQNSRQSVQHL